MAEPCAAFEIFPGRSMPGAFLPARAFNCTPSFPDPLSFQNLGRHRGRIGGEAVTSIVILDACRHNPAPRLPTAQTPKSTLEAQLGETFDGKNRAYLTENRQ
jgi:hypothetical protein